MVFAGVSNESVQKEERTIVTRILVVFGLTLFFILLILTFFANGLIKRLKSIASYMANLAESSTSIKVPKNVFEKNDEINKLRDAIDALPFQEKQVIVLRYFNDMKLEDIAKALSISRSTVKRYLQSAKEKLMWQL